MVSEASFPNWISVYGEQNTVFQEQNAYQPQGWMNFGTGSNFTDAPTLCIIEGEQESQFLHTPNARLRDDVQLHNMR